MLRDDLGASIRAMPVALSLPVEGRKLSPHSASGGRMPIMPALLFLALAAARSPPVDAGAPEPLSERKICKTETRIGTLAGRKRICRTAAEWQEVAARARQTYQDVQGTHGSSHSVEPPPQPVPQ